MNNLNMMFWIAYAGAAVVAVSIALSSYFVIGVVFTLIIIVSGTAKLEQDRNEKMMSMLFNDISNGLHLLSFDMDKTQKFSVSTAENMEKYLREIKTKNMKIDKNVGILQNELEEKVELVETKVRRLHKRKIYKDILNKVSNVESRIRGIYEAPAQTLN